MKVIRGTPSSLIHPPCALTIGNFDGLHLGHRKLLQTSLQWSKANGGQSVVLTFGPHPMAVFAQANAFQRLFDREDQRQMFQHLGVAGAFVQPFVPEFFNTANA